jgi:hypothetical protein
MRDGAGTGDSPGAEDAGGGAESGGAESGGAESGGAESGGAGAPHVTRAERRGTIARP